MNRFVVALVVVAFVFLGLSASQEKDKEYPNEVSGAYVDLHYVEAGKVLPHNFKVSGAFANEFYYLALYDMVVEEYENLVVYRPQYLCEENENAPKGENLFLQQLMEVFPGMRMGFGVFVIDKDDELTLSDGHQEGQWDDAIERKPCLKKFFEGYEGPQLKNRIEYE